jgi:hypothetical protein
MVDVRRKVVDVVLNTLYKGFGQLIFAYGMDYDQRTIGHTRAESARQRQQDAGSQRITSPTWFQGPLPRYPLFPAITPASELRGSELRLGLVPITQHPLRLDRASQRSRPFGHLPLYPFLHGVLPRREDGEVGALIVTYHSGVDEYGSGARQLDTQSKYVCAQRPEHESRMQVRVPPNPLTT